MKQLFFGLLIGLCAHAHAHAEKAGRIPLGEIRTDTVATNSRTRYTFNTESKTYELAENQVRSTTKMIGTGVFGTLQETSVDEDSKVIGRDIKGYARISLFERDGKFFIKDMISVDDKLEGLDIKFESEVEIEVELKKGTVDDYRDGRRVELGMTAEGKRRWLESSSRPLNEILKTNLEKSLADAFPQVKAESSLDQIEMSDLSRIIVDANELIIEVPSYRVRVQVSVFLSEPVESSPR